MPPTDDTLVANPPNSADLTEEREIISNLLIDARALVRRLEARLANLDGVANVHPVTRYRKQLGMSQVALAKAVGISPPALCRIEHSPGFSARPSTRARIAACLNVSEDLLHDSSSD